MIDICMLTCNRARLTRIAIEELKRRTTTPHRLAVLDNGSTDGTVEVLQDLRAQGLIDALELADENRGVHWGHNRLLDNFALSDVYVCTDPDIVPQAPTPAGDWLLQLLVLIDERPDYAAIACRPHAMIGDGKDMFDGAPAVLERGHVGAVLRLMRTDAVTEAGGWKKVQRPSRNHEERWICGKLAGAGWKVGYARDVRAIHLFGDPEQGEDPWGYPAEMTPQEHGHRPVWPPPHAYGWERRGVDWDTCK